MHSTILVVEDDLTLLQLNALVLSGWGYQVLSAATGKAALQAWHAHDGPIDLLFTDVFLPDMTGVELAAALVALQPDLKVVYTTGAERARVDPLFDSPDEIRLLKKPATLDRLKACIEEALAA
jgi:CheY-like chemotaxis protein